MSEQLPASDESEIVRHTLAIEGRGINLGVAAINGPDEDIGNALIIEAVEDGCLVRVQDRHDYHDHTGVGLRVNFEHASIPLMVREGAGVIMHLDYHGQTSRMAGGNGLVWYARILRLVEKEGISEADAYKRLGIENRLTYSNSRRVLQQTLGLSAIRLLVSKEDNEADVQKIIETLENNGDGLDVSVVSLDDTIEKIRAGTSIWTISESPVVEQSPGQQSRAARLRGLFRRIRNSTV